MEIAAYNEAGELVKFIGSGMVSGNDVTGYEAIVNGRQVDAFDPADGAVDFRFTGIWTPSNPLGAYVDFTWDGKNQNAQDIGPGMYYIKTSITDAFGHVDTEIKELQVLKSEQYVRVSIYNTAGELVRRIEDTTVPNTDVSLGVDDVIYVGQGTSAPIKISGTQTINWDGKNATGRTVESGVYEVVLEVQKSNGYQVMITKTITVLEQKGDTILSEPGNPNAFPKAYPNPLFIDAGKKPLQAITIEWYSTAQGEVIIKIYNIAGELVRLARADMAVKMVTLDAETSGGESISSGLYVVLLQANAQDGRKETKITKFTVIKKYQ
jgi:flagellar hook assembly protein FlgD